MNYHYIYLNLFVTSDQQLSSDEYQIGNSLNDYINGMYIPLNEQLIEYEREHPNASPEEVFEMKPLLYLVHVRTPLDEMFGYFETEHNHIYINNEIHHCWDHREIEYAAQCAKTCNEEYFTFVSENKYFRDIPDNIISIMRLIGLYYYKYGITTNKHYRYLEKHPDLIGTYDYTIGFPEVPHFTILEVDDID